ncbi:type I DNA topoisomerase [Bacteroidetes bacterium endosymbiont of Geopemphigus sp.]|uniref:type I DNA topoisomerase n=1 Tax=Bacteroidetes bacterium endosymbiont of Geopemphigus sp. TaxID=2047937 RepID=UPI000CD05352|nr:type I DNA topoisomerase [Bacteroidetes bacterium endosymbiont of Geopemphigus sp.]
MAKNLVIVESPAKAKTIQGYLGKDFEVASSFGHIADLPEKGMGVDIQNNFEPVYVVPPDKKSTVKKLQSMASKSDTIWLASDEDREGEAIAWHLYKELKIPENKLRRIVFHEITKKAIMQAIEKPRAINQDLVDAQQARRVLDRLVGFELSPVLWKKIKTGLSAGRVQSVAVRLIVEREKDIRAFKAAEFYKVAALFLSEKGEEFKAQLENTFENKEQAEAFLKKCMHTQFSAYKIVIKPGKKSPSAPFTTSSLQQETSKKLGYSVARTMRLAQQLYEEGYITYMRTDSLNLSEDAITAVKDHIITQFGEKYACPRRYTTKNKSAQEAHEAIRPTDINKLQVGQEIAQQRLYELIWKRTLAGQMSEAILERTILYIRTPDQSDFIAKGQVITFDGFLKLYKENSEIINKGEFKDQLPKIKEGELLKNEKITSMQRFTKHPPRYSEASLVKTLEELGIGRPSTYVPTISTIQRRNYVELMDLEGSERSYEIMTLTQGDILKKQEKEIIGADKKKLIPTDVGIVVNDFLVGNFQHILDYGFTAKVEESFDEIAKGKEVWNTLIKRFYSDFHPKVEDATKSSAKSHGERLLGTDSKSGKRVFARIGRFGPMIQMGEVENEEKPRFASLLKDQHIDSISLEEALQLFELPRKLGTFEENEINVSIGRFGPYIKHDGKFISIKEESGYSPYKITLEQAIELIERNREESAKNLIRCFEEVDPPIEVINGRFGPYIRQRKANYKIPKNLQLEKLNVEVCKKIISQPKPKEKRKKFKE